MSHTKVAFLFFLFLFNNCFAQNQLPEKYNIYISQADSLSHLKDYRNAALMYSAAFQEFGGKGLLPHRYRAARAWALSGNADSAFFNLDRIAGKGGYGNYREVANDTAFISLRSDKRWLPLMILVKQNRDKPEGNLNKPLIDLLDSLVREDQRWRVYMTQYKNKQLRADTIPVMTISKNMMRADSLDLMAVRRIFNQYGFPNFDLVGTEGAHDFWLITQHQDKHPAFQDSVLKAMKVQVDNRKAHGTEYAYLVDRVKINTGQLQVYGTQMRLNADTTSYEPMPVIEPQQLNERRHSVGLEPIEDYIKTMNERYFGTLHKKSGQ
jgi:hypothetical protein